MNIEEIKSRDRWSCKRCAHKFDTLEVLKFGDDTYITLCGQCLDWALQNVEESKILFKSLIANTKVVFIGDCHGNFERLDQILSEEEPFDLFISVGDFSDGSIPENNWGGRGYYVKGNHDDFECLKQLELCQELRGITVCGLSGMIRNKNFLKDTDNNISFREVLYLSHLKNVDILVTHQAPTGVFNGMGEPVLEELLNYLVPKIYVFGHIHRFKFKFHLNTFVISLPIITKGHAVAYFQGKDLRNLELVFKRGKKFVRV